MTVVAVMLVSLDLSGVEGLPRFCSGQEPSSESVCEYGVTEDSCGNTVCLMGPGHRCGGRYSR